MRDTRVWNLRILGVEAASARRSQPMVSTGAGMRERISRTAAYIACQFGGGFVEGVLFFLVVPCLRLLVLEGLRCAGRSPSSGEGSAFIASSIFAPSFPRRPLLFAGNRDFWKYRDVVSFSPSLNSNSDAVSEVATELNSELSASSSSSSSSSSRDTSTSGCCSGDLFRATGGGRGCGSGRFVKLLLLLVFVLLLVSATSTLLPTVAAARAAFRVDIVIEVGWWVGWWMGVYPVKGDLTPGM